MSRRRLRTAAAGIAVLAGLALSSSVLAPPAVAAGDPAVDRYLVVEPVPGWTTVPISQAQVKIAEGSLNSFLQTGGVTGKIAIGEWQDPADVHDIVVVQLVTLDGHLPKADLVNLAAGALPTALVGACESLTLAQPVGNVHPLSDGSQIYQDECSKDPYGDYPTVVGFSDENTVAVVIGTKLVPINLEPIAYVQLSRLPAHVVQFDVPTPHRSGGISTGIVVGIASGLVGALAAVAVLLLLRFRRAPATAGAPAIRPPTHDLGPHGAWATAPTSVSEQDFPLDGGTHSAPNDTTL